MIFKFISSLLVFSFAFSASAADSVNDNDDEVKQFREFFEKYELLGSQYDTALADLYADTANIMAVRVLPDGTEQKMAMDGKKWKQLIVDSMGFAKQRGDNNKFSELHFSKDGDTLKITATRYSALKCFEDPDFSMVLKRETDGKIVIIEEFSRAPQKSNCEELPENDLDLSLQATAAAISKKLPVMLDSETRLENVSSKGKVLVYQYELVHYAASGLDAAALKKTIESLAIRQTCSTPNLRSLVDRGATISYRYSGKDKVLVLEINVNNTSCL